MIIQLFPELSKVLLCIFVTGITITTVLPHVVAKCEVNCLVPFCDIVVS